MTTTDRSRAGGRPLGRAGLQALRNYLRGWRGAAVLASIVACRRDRLGMELAAGRRYCPSLGQRFALRRDVCTRLVRG